MFSSLGGLFQNFEDFLRLAKDENFQKFYNNPKVRELMKDPEFQRAAHERNVFSLMANREFAELLKDPEVQFALEEMRRKFEKNA